MCTRRSLLKLPSRARAPSSGAASTALERRLLVGGRCALRLESFGFARGKASARCFYHAVLDVRRA
eukprot:10591581-Alexandrium_andersonii.AAC.1